MSLSHLSGWESMELARAATGPPTARRLRVTRKAIAELVAVALIVLAAVILL